MNIQRTNVAPITPAGRAVVDASWKASAAAWNPDLPGARSTPTKCSRLACRLADELAERPFPGFAQPGAPASGEAVLSALVILERDAPVVRGIRGVELGGLEPPTSWVRSIKSAFSRWL
jgi:hypothetical protein